MFKSISALFIGKLHERLPRRANQAGLAVADVSKGWDSGLSQFRGLPYPIL